MDMNQLKHYEGKIIYSLVSSAYFVDKSWGYGIPKAGMKLMYDIGHRYNIPVTFLITSQVALECHRMLTQFHHHGNACVGLMLDFPDQMDETGKRIKGSDDIIDKMSEDDLRAYIRSEIAMIKKALPWADIKILGGGYRNERVVNAAEAEGLLGIWGYCIFQIGTDNITDYGCPWGQFFIDKENFKAPSPTPRNIIGMEWTCRDISKAFHMAKSESYSTDPNDAESNGKCTDTDIRYWIDLLTAYQHNLQYNPLVFFLQHQESHEMESSEVCVGYNQLRVDYTAKMLDKFCAYVSSQKNIQCVTLNTAAEIYITKYQGLTPPTYFFQQDIPIRTPEWEQHVRDNTADKSKHIWIGFHEKLYDYIDNYVGLNQFHFKSPPWQSALFYYDKDCLLIFDKGIREPIWISDYRHPNGSRDEQFMWIPSPSITSVMEEAQGAQRIYTYTIQSDHTQPYGLVEWVNLTYGALTIKDCSVSECKIIQETGIFMRINLQPGKNVITLILEGKAYSN